MANRRTTFDKMQRERDKRMKAEAKRDRRLAKGKAPAEGEDGGAPAAAGAEDGPSTPELLAMIERIHHQVDAHEIGQEEFEERKADLLARLPID